MVYEGQKELIASKIAAVARADLALMNAKADLGQTVFQAALIPFIRATAPVSMDTNSVKGIPSQGYHGRLRLNYDESKLEVRYFFAYLSLVGERFEVKPGIDLTVGSGSIELRVFLPRSVRTNEEWEAAWSEAWKVMGALISAWCGPETWQKIVQAPRGA